MMGYKIGMHFINQFISTALKESLVKFQMPNYLRAAYMIYTTYNELRSLILAWEDTIKSFQAPSCADLGYGNDGTAEKSKSLGEIIPDISIGGLIGKALYG
jgi:hypothetical protein